MIVTLETSLANERVYIQLNHVVALFEPVKDNPEEEWCVVMASGIKLSVKESTALDLMRRVNASE